MIKFAKVINAETGLVEVGLGTNNQFYKSIGMEQLDVQQSNINEKWYLSEKCPMKSEEEKEQEEQERIAMLSLTSADVERGIYKATGMDFDDILALVVQLKEAQDERVVNLDIKELKIELKANNFYRGNPYVDAVGSLLGFTKEQLDAFFETGDFIYLMEKEELISEDEIPF